MAYEAMNNAGAMNSRLIVVLNDNDMSIAPPVGALSAYLARRVSGRGLSRRAQLHAPDRQAPAEQHAREARARDGGICARPRHRRHAVRRARLLLCRPDRRPQHRSPAAGAEKRARRQERAVPGPRRHAEGQGLRAGGKIRRQISRRRQVRRRDRRAGESESRRAGLSEGLRRKPDQGSAQGSEDRRHHRGDAVGHRRRSVPEGISRTAPSTSASPSSTA